MPEYVRITHLVAVGCEEPMYRALVGKTVKVVRRTDWGTYIVESEEYGATFEVLRDEVEGL